MEGADIYIRAYDSARNSYLCRCCFPNKRLSFLENLKIDGRWPNP